MKKRFIVLLLSVCATTTYAQQNNGEKTISLSNLMKATGTEVQPQQEEVRSVSLSTLMGTVKKENAASPDSVPASVSTPSTAPKTQATTQSNNPLVLVGKALGNIKIGMRMSDVPQSVKGLYANRGELEMTGEAGEAYNCRDQAGDIVIEIADQDENGIVDALFIQAKGVQIANSPLYIGMPAEELLRVEGVKAGTDQYGNEEIRYRDYFLNTGYAEGNNEDLILYSISFGFDYQN
ncbi:MAG: hypothetical protein K6C10_05325 [Prevotella sp.]|nr:hypothetical protein [Prevotella sp.]